MKTEEWSKSEQTQKDGLLITLLHCGEICPLGAGDFGSDRRTEEDPL